MTTETIQWNDPNVKPEVSGLYVVCALVDYFTYKEMVFHMCEYDGQFWHRVEYFDFLICKSLEYKGWAKLKGPA